MTTTTQRRHPPDYVLLTLVGVLVPLGIVMVYSASFIDAYVNHQNQLYYMWRQLAAAGVGGIGMLIAQRMDYRFFRRYSIHFMAFALFLLVLTLILPRQFTTINGAHSWIRIGGFSLQPSELAKLALVIYMADWLSRRGGKLTNVTYGLLPFALMLGVVCGLVMLGRDMGTTVVIIVIGGIVYFAAGANLLHLAGALAIASVAFWGLVNMASYRIERIAAWIDPFEYYFTSGYQPVHSLYAFASGGLFGVGIGQSRQKFLWLPQAHTDAIFAIIGEEFGLIGTLFIVGCFVLLAYRGMVIAARVRDPFAALLATGITVWLVFQALINMAVVTTLLPFTGLTLPFISYGGTSLMISMVAMGVLLSVSRQMGEPEPADNQTVKDGDMREEPLGMRRRDWRARVPGAGGRRSAQRAWGGIRRS